MKRWLIVLCACLTGMLCFAGCANRELSDGHGESYEETGDRPQLPEDIVLVDGIPQIDVYDVAAESVRRMDLEEYVAGVLAGEMKNDWPEEALKAQAILARTFVMKFISTKDSRYEGADISTDVSEAQAYNAEAVNDRILRAVEQTRGLVMNDDGELPHAWFHAHSGGMTELPSVALDYTGGDPDYLEPVRIAESEKAPEDVKQWEATFSHAQLIAACRAAGLAVERIERVAIGETGESGRAKQLLINGEAVSAPTLRLKLDASKLKSTKITSISVQDDKITFTGSGFGHGVGMSQWGAYALAEQGKSAEEIIEAYFDDVDIVQMWK